MSKQSTFLFSDEAPADYSGANKAAAIVVAAGKLRCVQVSVPPEGRVTRLVVKQSAGTPVAFAVDLYASVAPYAVGEAADGTAPGVTVPDLFRAVPNQQTATAGNAVKFQDSVGICYRNLDGPLASSEPSLYLVIIPTAGAGTTWEARLDVEADT